MDNLFEIFVIAIYGLCIGSFLNVVIYRVGKTKETIIGRSYCTSCKNQLKWYHNIPLFSWLFLRGKCGFCKTPISIQYPVIETLTTLIALLVYYNNGMNWYSLATFATFTTLLAIATIDIKYKMVPDSLSILALIFSFLHSPYIIESLQYALMLMGTFYVIRILGEFVFNKEIMGEGDILITGIIGSMLPNIQDFMTSIMITALAALIPALIAKIKYSKIENIEFDNRFDILEKNIIEMVEKDKDDIVYQEKMKILKDGIENFKIKDNAVQGVPFIPYLLFGLTITYFFNLSFY